VTIWKKKKKKRNSFSAIETLCVIVSKFRVLDLSWLDVAEPSALVLQLDYCTGIVIFISLCNLFTT
jgi:hypothetical protein